MDDTIREAWTRLVERDGSDPGLTLGGTSTAATSGDKATRLFVGPSESSGTVRYRLIDESADRQRGMILRCEQLALGREVALKVLGPNSEAKLKAALQVEARVLGALDHPNIVPIHELGDDYYTMKLVHGSNLLDRLEDGPMDPAEAIDLSLKVADAVAYAHAQSIIHRDLKPANVLLGEQGAVWLVDWGLACAASDAGEDCPAPQLTAESALAGTPAYLPPECALGALHDIGYATDVFLLAATLYHLVSGRPPFAADDPLLCIARSLDHHIDLDLVPEILQPVLRKALAAATSQRGSLVDLVTGLRRARGHLTSHRQAAERARCLADARPGTASDDDTHLQAIEEADTIVTLDPSETAYQLLRAEIYATYLTALIDRGDLSLAELLLERASGMDRDPHASPTDATAVLQASRDRLARAQTRLAQRARQYRLAQRCLQAAGLLVLLCLGWLWVQSLGWEERELAARQRQANAALQDLNAEIATVGDPAQVDQARRDAWLDRLRLVQALWPETEALASTAGALLQHSCAQALEAGDGDLALLYCQDLDSFGLSTASTISLRQQAEALVSARARENARRDRLLADIQAGAFTTKQWNWYDEIIADLRSWDQAPQALRDCFTHASPSLRCLACDAFALHADWDDQTALLTTSADPHPVVALQALRALLVREDPRAIARIHDILGDQDLLDAAIVLLPHRDWLERQLRIAAESDPSEPERLDSLALMAAILGDYRRASTWGHEPDRGRHLPWLGFILLKDKKFAELLAWSEAEGRQGWRALAQFHSGQTVDPELGQLAKALAWLQHGGSEPPPASVVHAVQRGPLPAWQGQLGWFGERLHNLGHETLAELAKDRGRIALSHLPALIRRHNLQAHEDRLHALVQLCHPRTAFPAVSAPTTIGQTFAQWQTAWQERPANLEELAAIASWPALERRRAIDRIILQLPGLAARPWPGDAQATVVLQLVQHSLSRDDLDPEAIQRACRLAAEIWPDGTTFITTLVHDPAAAWARWPERLTAQPTLLRFCSQGSPLPPATGWRLTSDQRKALGTWLADQIRRSPPLQAGQLVQIVHADWQTNTQVSEWIDTTLATWIAEESDP